MPHRKVSVIGAFLDMTESGLEMSGHFFRDIAVLVLVFVPIDIWTHQPVMKSDLVGLGGGSLVVFAFGMALQWVSSLVKWAKEIWAEEDMG